MERWWRVEPIVRWGVYGRAWSECSLLRVLPSQAKPGMVLAMPVLHPEIAGHMLLRPGAHLDEYSIRKLEEIRVPGLWIEYPPLSFLMRFLDPRLVAEHEELTATLAEGFEKFSQGTIADLDYVGYARSVRAMLKRMMDDGATGLFVADMLRADGELAAHASTVCFLSMLMGLKLEAYLMRERRRVSAFRAKRVENLGVGALLADAGMIRIDAETRERWLTNQDTTDRAWRRHVIEGYRMVRQKISATAAGVVLHHHQRLDGSGFPAIRRGRREARALRGNDIHVFARIVAVADEFEWARRAAVKRLGGGSAEAGATVAALKHVLENVRRGKLDRVVFGSLTASVPAFAPGSMVTLDNGATAVVSGVNGLDPCRPEVCFMIERGGRVHEADRWKVGARFDLALHCDRRIVEVNGINVDDSNFFAATPDEFDYRRACAPLADDHESDDRATRDEQAA